MLHYFIFQPTVMYLLSGTPFWRPEECKDHKVTVVKSNNYSNSTNNNGNRNARLIVLLVVFKIYDR